MSLQQRQLCVLVMSAALCTILVGDLGKSADLPNAFRLFCGIEGVKLGMSEETLRTVRPAVRPDTSTMAFVESLPGCWPDFENVEYHFDDNRLVGILFSRHWTLTPEPITLSQHVPDILRRSTGMWGQPSSVGQTVKAFGEGTQFRFSALVWNRGSYTTILRYTPQDTIDRASESRNRAVPISISVFIASGRRGDEAEAWLDLMPDKALLQRVRDLSEREAR